MHVQYLRAQTPLVQLIVMGKLDKPSLSGGVYADLVSIIIISAFASDVWRHLPVWRPRDDRGAELEALTHVDFRA